MTSYLIVFLGAGIGGALRHGGECRLRALLRNGISVGHAHGECRRLLHHGVLAGWLAFKAGEGWSQPLRLFLTTGILGGFTTFSAFSLDAMLIWERGQGGLAVVYVGASVLLSIAGLAIGLGAVRAIAS